MSLEQFKTQVLLLHSEQSTLDDLSAGFGDRYTVHCATSGSEALNTLGQTQIDVIVTAQELPGMSGLDALREAKKRSPDTIGILLAGREGDADGDGDGIEALVGDQEVFQVVRGDVTPDSLRALIDNATRQARLIALTESANDTMANVDQPVAEHIVMETSENGSSIISDGTGRLPALDPKKISAAAEVGSRAVDVLVLTKDDEFLTTVRESARGLHNVIYANTLAQADDAVRKHKIGVAVVDAAMVGSNVEKLTLHLRAATPRLVAIVAGRRDDGEMLMDLINRGKVYRFLLKPVSPGRSRLAIEASVKHHLEAPDTAFTNAGKVAKIAAMIAPKPQLKAKPKAKPKVKPKAKPKAVPKAEPKAVPKPVSRPRPSPAPQAKERRQQPPSPTPIAKAPVPGRAGSKRRVAVKRPARVVPNPKEAFSPIDDRLGSAFAENDTSALVKIMGLVKLIAKFIFSIFKLMAKFIFSIFATSSSKADITSKPAAAGSGGSLLARLKMPGIAAAAIIAVASGSYWMFSGSDESPAVEDSLAGTPSISEVDVVFDTAAPAGSGLNIDELLDEARLAAAAGQVINPPGSNAMELYMAAIAAAPDDAVVVGEFTAIIDRALSMAESALLESRVDDATAALKRVEAAAPENPRLPFLNAQLAQVQLRNYIDGARDAIRETRFEDATIALKNARLLAVTDATEIDVVASELDAALSEQRVDDVLAKASARLDEGKLIAPSNDNARYYYELARSIDVQNAAARHGLTVVASKLVLQARTQIDDKNFDAADSLLADARGLDPSSSDLAASAEALQAARDRQVQQRRAAERAAAEQAAVERAAAEQAAAERAVAEQAAAERAAAERAAAERAAAERASADRAAAEQAAAEAQSADALASDSVPSEQQAAVPDAPQKQVSLTASFSSSAPVPISSLQRTRYVAPKYPRAAQRRGISGWVDVVITVEIDGTVADVTIRDSNPDDTFVAAAIKAAEGWEFEPVIENGIAIRKRAAVRMMFAIE